MQVMFIGTSCVIAKHIGENKYLTIGCRIDGYVASAGKHLNESYNTPEKVDELLACGDIYSVASVLESGNLEFNSEHRAKELCIEDILDGGVEAEYLYIFTQDNRWKYLNLTGGEMELRELNEVLKANEKQVYDVNDPYAWLKAELNKFLVSPEPNESPIQPDMSMT